MLGGAFNRGDSLSMAVTIGSGSANLQLETSSNQTERRGNPVCTKNSDFSLTIAIIPGDAGSSS